MRVAVLAAHGARVGSGAGATAPVRQAVASGRAVARGEVCVVAPSWWCARVRPRPVCQPSGPGEYVVACCLRRGADAEAPTRQAVINGRAVLAVVAGERQAPAELYRGPLIGIDRTAYAAEV